MTSRLREWCYRLGALFRRRTMDHDLGGELESHLEMAIEDNLARGMAPDEARRRAMLSLGGFDQAREAHRDARGVPLVESTMRDIGYACRTLRRSPGFTAVAVTVLALGIGANTAIFSVVSAVLLRPLPFLDPDRVVLLWDDFSSRRGPERVEPTPADYVDWKAQSQSFTDLAAMLAVSYNLTGAGEPERLAGVRTTANLFEIVGVRALIGRTMMPQDEGPEAGAVVVLGERFWRSRFASDRTLVGRTIDLNGLAHTVVGVVPSDFQFPDKDLAVWVPARFSGAELASRVSYNYNVVARLKPDVSLAMARAEMRTIAQRLATEHPTFNSGVSVTVTTVHEHLTRTTRPALMILLGAVGLVLLMACANVGNLLLARGAGRQREIALRKALGAGRARIIRQLLTENAVLALISVVCAIALATLSFNYLSRLIPGGLPLDLTPTIDTRVLVFTIAVTVALLLALGIVPALAVTRTGAATLFATRGPALVNRRLRHLLVIGEMTVTVVLLVGIGLLIRSHIKVTRVDLGFQADNLVIAETALSPTRYATFESRVMFFEQVLGRLREVPGVLGVAYANSPPLVFKGGRSSITIQGRPLAPQEPFGKNLASDRAVSPGYHVTLGAPLLSGRHIDERDRAGSPPVVLINQKMATLRWGDADPVGSQLKLGAAASANPWFTVIGVVGDVRQMSLEQPPEAEIYFSLAQQGSNPQFLWPRYLVVRTSVSAASLAGPLRQAVWAVDRDQPVSNVRSMNEVVDQELMNRSTQMMLVGAFALLAVLMASVGLGGVLSYTVAQRVSEIGVRMALGADRRRVAWEVLRGALRLAAMSVVIGLASAFALSRVLESLLYSVSPTDRLTFAVAACLVVLIAAGASYVPARRAARIDPAQALRTG